VTRGVCVCVCCVRAERTMMIWWVTAANDCNVHVATRRAHIRTLIVAVHGFIAGLASIVMLLFVCYLMMHIDFKQLTLLWINLGSTYVSVAFCIQYWVPLSAPNLSDNIVSVCFYFFYSPTVLLRTACLIQKYRTGRCSHSLVLGSLNLLVIWKIV